MEVREVQWRGMGVVTIPFKKFTSVYFLSYLHIFSQHVHIPRRYLVFISCFIPSGIHVPMTLM